MGWTLDITQVILEQTDNYQPHLMANIILDKKAVDCKKSLRI